MTTDRASRWLAGLCPVDSTGAPKCLPSPVHSAAGSRVYVASRGMRGAASWAVPAATSHAPPVVISRSSTPERGPAIDVQVPTAGGPGYRSTQHRGDGVPYSLVPKKCRPEHRRRSQRPTPQAQFPRPLARGRGRQVNQVIWHGAAGLIDDVTIVSRPAAHSHLTGAVYPLRVTTTQVP